MAFQNMDNIQYLLLMAEICKATNEEQLATSELSEKLQKVKAIKPKNNSIPVRAFCGILHNRLVFSFRGTAARFSASADDWQQSILGAIINVVPALMPLEKSESYQIISTDWLKEIYGAYVHAGFAVLLEAILQNLEECIQQTPHDGVVFTGHSLGGALATLAAMRLRKVCEVSGIYTFGSPRVGDIDFSSQYKLRHWRVENKNDLVPHLPPDPRSKPFFNSLFQSIGIRDIAFTPVSFLHVGELIFFDWRGHIRGDSLALRKRRFARVVQDPLKGIKEHSILEYINSISQSTYKGSSSLSIDQTRGTTVKNNNSNPAYNIIIIGKAGVGKAGVGKSSLINYLYGDNIAESGVGKSVTLPGFHRYSFRWKGTDVSIYDSAGLEVGKHDEWMSLLNQELYQRAADKPASEWFHTVFYVINAAGNRVEEFELEVIKKFISENYRVVIVMTHADKVSIKSIEKLESVIANDLPETVSIVRVCNVEEELLSGHKSEPFGADKLQEETIKGFWYAITIRLPDRIESLLHVTIDKWRNEQVSYVKTNSNFWNTGTIFSVVKERFDELQEDLVESRFRIIRAEVENTVTYFQELAERLDYPSPDDFPDLRVIKISDSFIRVIQRALAEFKNFFVQRLAALLNIFSLQNPPLESEITRACNQLKREVTSQKPQIRNLVQSMLQQKTERPAQGKI